MEEIGAKANPEEMLIIADLFISAKCWTSNEVR
jgi:hypothetical protein